ncbi:CRISPR-associated protein Cas5t [Clostridium sp. DSM 8431]|uniref:CRISPR-associated protein Cas5 n=1 Tax=Clostridium sp. DSM 8431 TaxID=1761781 RepID=UPI0008F07AA7|nr:CRISPR-associated protein Cas5 [Clostridium sp. DSM 8431]SFU69151.1 CRISPR-associated protein Cas5t [Clostridium sp. DSM 8431]
MKVLRICLTQSSANYKKEEALDNKMTYPLPPVSTIIGAIHNACSYKEYHPMDISIQGKYESMHREPYTDYCFLNSIMDDRGILVKMKNESMLSRAYEKVAAAKKSQGNSFREGKTIQVFNKELLDEYRNLKKLKDEIDTYKKNDYKEKVQNFKNKKKELADLKKRHDKKSEEYIKITTEEKEVKRQEKEFKEKFSQYENENYTKPFSKFRSLTTSLKFYEILNNISLVIHVRSDESTLNDIEENIYNLKSIGRSEDFVNIEECCFVELKESDELEVFSDNSAFLNFNDVLEENIFFDKAEADRAITGTKYYLNKNYDLVDGKRQFNKKKVLYASNYYIDKTSENVLIDDYGDKTYIVNFI